MTKLPDGEEIGNLALDEMVSAAEFLSKVSIRAIRLAEPCHLAGVIKNLPEAAYTAVRKISQGYMNDARECDRMQFEHYSLPTMQDGVVSDFVALLWYKKRICPADFYSKSA